MREKVVVRAMKPHRSAKSAMLRLFNINEAGHETLIMTSSPIPKVVATGLCRLFEQPHTILPSIDSLKAVLQIPGRTAWASAAAESAKAAALQACLQHDLTTAHGALVILTLSPTCAIVASVKAALNVIHDAAPSVTKTAVFVAYDEALCGQARVEILLMEI